MSLWIFTRTVLFKAQSNDVSGKRKSVTTESTNIPLGESSTRAMVQEKN